MTLGASFDLQLDRIQRSLREPYQRVARPRAVQASEPSSAILWHGTLSGYNHHRCRCLACRAAVARHASSRTRARRQQVDTMTGRGYVQRVERYVAQQGVA